MKYLKKELSLKECLEKEWIITNGIGGYASSTIIGANTRKYHGLLIAALTPPARRYLILSKLDESIEINGTKHVLYTNVCKNYISEGFKNKISFEKDTDVKFEYQVKDINIKKEICLLYGENTVCVKYTIKNNFNLKTNIFNKKFTFVCFYCYCVGMFLYDTPHYAFYIFLSFLQN